MILTLPHMGNVYIGAKALFDGLGIKYIIPPLNSNKALEIGTLYSPEEICLPFKIQIGNYIQSIEMGADTIIITGSTGPCRFGEYCELQMNILKSLGKKVDFIVLDSPKDIGRNELLHRVLKISSESTKNSLMKMKAFFDALKVINLIDQIEAQAHYLAGYEKNKGECKKLLKEAKEKSYACNNPSMVIRILKHYSDKLNSIKTDNTREPIKIAIIGEIYTIIEPFSNQYIEEKLMDYGISTIRTLSPSWWLKNLFLLPFHLNNRELNKEAKKHLPFTVGGHGMECVGEAGLSIKNGIDGAIQIFPVGCMPEIVAKSVLSDMSLNNNFPVLNLIVDEMTGEAGYITRVEAFIDLLERKKNNVLSGS